MIVLDLDHSEDPYYGHHGYLPLFRFEGRSDPFITAALRPGHRPTGAENAMIVRRVLKRLRAAWPQTRIILRGDAHFAHPEWMQRAMADPQLDFLFRLAGNRALSPLAEPFLAPHRRRLETARRAGLPLPTPTHSYHQIAYRAESWPQAAYGCELTTTNERNQMLDHNAFATALPLDDCYVG